MPHPSLFGPVRVLVRTRRLAQAILANSNAARDLTSSIDVPSEAR